MTLRIRRSECESKILGGGYSNHPRCIWALWSTCKHECERSFVPTNINTKAKATGYLWGNQCHIDLCGNGVDWLASPHRLASTWIKVTLEQGKYATGPNGSMFPPVQFSLLCCMPKWSGKMMSEPMAEVLLLSKFWLLRNVMWGCVAEAGVDRSVQGLLVRSIEIHGVSLCKHRMEDGRMLPLGLKSGSSPTRVYYTFQGRINSMRIRPTAKGESRKSQSSGSTLFFGASTCLLTRNSSMGPSKLWSHFLERASMCKPLPNTLLSEEALKKSWEESEHLTPIRKACSGDRILSCTWAVASSPALALLNLNGLMGAGLSKATVRGAKNSVAALTGLWFGNCRPRCQGLSFRIPIRPPAHI